MAEFIRRHSLLFASVVLLVSCFQLTSVSIKDPSLPRLGGAMLNSAIEPAQNIHHKLFSSIRNVWTSYIWLVNVTSERDELLRQISNLEAQNSRLVESEHENQRLRKLLAFSEETGLLGVTATVIGRDPSNWVRAVTIDRGEDDGIVSGLPVVYGNAIVGQTTVVSKHSARVLLITDSRSSLDAIVQHNRGPGIVEGTSRNQLALRYLVKEYPANLGDRVVASGLDRVFPKGALVGIVTGAVSDTNGLFQEVILEPSVDLHRLENVLVVKPARNHKLDIPLKDSGESIQRSQKQ